MFNQQQQIIQGVNYYPQFAGYQVQAPQQPVIYGEQAPQQVQTDSVPLVPQQQPYHGSVYPQVVEQSAVPQSLPASQIPQQTGRCCAFRRCKFDQKKALKASIIFPMVVYSLGTIKGIFGDSSANHANLFSLGMLIAASVVGLIGLKKNKIVMLGIFMGMSAFFILSFIGHALGAVFFNHRFFWSFFNIFQGLLEILASASLTGAIYGSCKQIKRIKNEMELPLESAQAEPSIQEVNSVPAEVAPVAQLPPQIPVPAPAPAPVQFQAPVPVRAAPVVAPQPVQAPVQSAEARFSNELTLLREMGFTNTQLNLNLLQKHNGHLQSVVQEYIQTN